MKKIILSLSALMTVGIAAAQSYPKQPDPSVTYVEYKKVVKAETASETKQEAQQSPTSANNQDEAAVAIQPAASVNANAVSENRKNNPPRKED